MSGDLRIVIQVYDHSTMQHSYGSARLILNERQQALVATAQGLEPSIAAWAATELSSILSCLEDLSRIPQ